MQGVYLNRAIRALVLKIILFQNFCTILIGKVMFYKNYFKMAALFVPPEAGGNFFMLNVLAFITFLKSS